MSFFSSDEITIAGKAARDAEMRFTPSGDAVTKFSIPVDRSFKGKDGEWIKRTIWYNVEVWGALAEQANKRINKGAAVQVRGQLVMDAETGGPRIWTSKDGSPRSSFELRADNFGGLTFLSDGGAQDNAPSNIDSEDIPF